MKNIVALGDRVITNAIRNRGSLNEIEIVGTYRVEHIRDGQVIGNYEFKNLVTTEGKNYLLNAGLRGVTPINPWYVALVSNAGTPTAPAIGQIYDDFFNTTNVEYTDYTGGATSGDRIAYVEAVASGGVMTNNANKASFTFVTNPGTLYGACLVSREPKTDHTIGGSPEGYLLSFAEFTPTTISVVVTDVVNVEIELAFT